MILKIIGVLVLIALFLTAIFFAILMVILGLGLKDHMTDEEIEQIYRDFEDDNMCNL